MCFGRSYLFVGYLEAEKWDTESRVADPPCRGGEPTLRVADPACTFIKSKTFIIGHYLDIFVIGFYRFCVHGLNL